ncbi:MAG TPA: hypothetical protein VG675_16580 [Bryobacteraceae bacterium]|nr:hypothetical protein [Bryobacteraceae bacterium]
MSKRFGLALFLLLAALFLIANRGAYHGYFQDDEIDNLSWAPNLTVGEYLAGLVTPCLEPNNFRPVGHAYFGAAGHVFGLDFSKYVLVVQLLHLFNVWLIWVLARKLGASVVAAATGCVFFAFHMALFDAFWKPMYVFDVLCATFSLLSLLCYAARRWILSFLCFWMAYKAKELAVMLPLVLVCYEMWFGARRWKPLIPFFLVSISFGIQGVVFNPNHDNDYTFYFTPAALYQTSVYYAGRIFLVPYLGFVVPLAAYFARKRRVWFGLAMMGLFFFPLLFLPGRMFSAYCYVPFAGLAIAFSGVAEMERYAALAMFFLLWAPLDYRTLRANRRLTLARDDQAREYISSVGRFTASAPPIKKFVYDGLPDGFHSWGVSGALRYFLQRDDLEVFEMHDPAATDALHQDAVALMTWDGSKLDLVAHTPGRPEASYIEMNGSTPVWQLSDGWFGLEGTFRWTEPLAKARIRRPSGARVFELRVNVGPDLLKKNGQATVTIRLDNQELPPHRFAKAGWQTVRWDVPPAPPGIVQMTLRVDPPYRPSSESRLLGIAVGGFGFRDQ